jgi:putative transposase
VAVTLVTTHGLSVVRACQVAGLSRAAYYAPPVDRTEQDAAVIAALTAVAAKRPRWGFWKCWDRLRLDGHRWNWKKVYRVYCALRLNLPRRTKRRLPKRVLLPMGAPATLNRTWALDFMHDMLYDGRRFRTLNVIDEGNREGLAIEVGTSLTGSRVASVLDQLVAIHGAPRALRCDNGPELLSRPLTEWCERHGVLLQHIQPGKPNQNAYIERFNRTYRREVLDAYVFASLAQVRAETESWLTTYNTERPHDSLGGVPPLTYLPRPTPPPQSSYDLSA